MIQCPKCGVANADGTQFCSNCGNVFATAQPQMQPKNKSNLKIVLIVLGCIVGSCVLCGLIGGIKEAINPTPKTEVANQQTANGSTTQNTSQAKSSTTPSVTSTTNPKDEISSIKWSDVDRIYNLKSNSTDMQKEALWKDFKGKRVSWSGTVSEVSKGTFSGLSLQIKMNPDTLTSDIILSLKKEEEGEAINLTKGSKVSFVGTLNNYGGALLPMSLDDGEIK